MHLFQTRMKNILICMVLMAVIGTGECLTCSNCRVGIAGRCIFSSAEICSDSEPNCYTGQLAFNVTSLIGFQSQGCLSSSSCNQTETGSLLTAGYTITRTCCITDYCNGAASVQLALTAALGAAVTALWIPMAL